MGCGCGCMPLGVKCPVAARFCQFANCWQSRLHHRASLHVPVPANPAGGGTFIAPPWPGSVGWIPGFQRLRWAPPNHEARIVHPSQNVVSAALFCLWMWMVVGCLGPGYLFNKTPTSASLLSLTANPPSLQFAFASPSLTRRPSHHQRHQHVTFLVVILSILRCFFNSHLQSALLILLLLLLVLLVGNIPTGLSSSSYCGGGSFIDISSHLSIEIGTPSRQTQHRPRYDGRPRWLDINRPRPGRGQGPGRCAN